MGLNVILFIRRTPRAHVFQLFFYHFPSLHVFQKSVQNPHVKGLEIQKKRSSISVGSYAIRVYLETLYSWYIPSSSLNATIFFLNQVAILCNV